MHANRYNTFLKKWAQFHVGAIPRVPEQFTPLILYERTHNYDWSNRACLVDQ